ncbi:uncharacterized protein [Euphorbia lathyris]
MCARHVYAAWAKKWRGEERKKAFWACAKSTNMVDLKANLDVLKELGEGIVEDALSRSNHEIQSWCKAFFNTNPSCDVVDNNLSEMFNGWILESRLKAIITMLDEIRVLVMKRIAIKSKLPSTWICDISERAFKKLEQNIKESFDWQVDFNGDDGYEITHVNKATLRHIVQLEKKTCSCRAWELSGIPCQHAMPAILDAKKEPIDYVVHWYHKDTYLKAYGYKMQAMRGMDLWETEGCEELLPPPIKKMPGRPKKARRKDIFEEPKIGKLSRKGRVMTCSVCGGEKHNAAACKKKKISLFKPQNQMKTVRNKGLRKEKRNLLNLVKRQPIQLLCKSC